MLVDFKEKSDLIGAIASFTCMIHCLATPFLFIATVCTTTCCAAAPTWWVWLDFFFLFISYFAVSRSTKQTSKSWMKPALWTAWGALFLAIVIEQTGWIHFATYFKYIAAFSLIGLHLYNLKYCQCKKDSCCTK